MIFQAVFIEKLSNQSTVGIGFALDTARKAG
jgi:hypothetical protein